MQQSNFFSDSKMVFPGPVGTRACGGKRLGLVRSPLDRTYGRKDPGTYVVGRCRVCGYWSGIDCSTGLDSGIGIYDFDLGC